MSDIVSEDEGFDPKFFFPNFRGPSLDSSESSTELAESEATVVGFGKHDDILFTPIIGGHLNFTSQQEDDDYPVKNCSLPVEKRRFDWKRIFTKEIRFLNAKETFKRN